jgi:hypothetical protein
MNSLSCKCSNPLRNDYRAQSQLLHPMFYTLAERTRYLIIGTVLVASVQAHGQTDKPNALRVEALIKYREPWLARRSGYEGAV